MKADIIFWTRDAPTLHLGGVRAFLENIGFTEILIMLMTAAIIVAPVGFVVYLIRIARRRP